MSASAEPVKVSELERILALAKRPVVDCEKQRDASGKRVWSPEAQALIAYETARYSRGPRLSCGCRSRRARPLPGGRLLVFHEGRPHEPPPFPVEMDANAFLRDNAHDPAAVKAVSELRSGELVLPGLGHPFCLTHFNPVQAWTLRELPIARGIFGMISIGGGKTAIGILAPLAIQCRTVVLLGKPDQRLHYRAAYLRLREHFRVPSIVFDKTDLSGSYIVPGTPVLHFIPYSFLSSPKNSVFFESLEPDMIIADESHLLSNRDSSRTMRFLRYMTERYNTVLCDWSGSMFKKSIKDAAHLASHSLGINSPYPIPRNDVETFSQVIDPSPKADRISPSAKALWRAFNTGPTTKKHEELFEAGFLGDGGVRNGFRDRVIATLGVISTRSSSVDCSIALKEWKPSPMPKQVSEAVTLARKGTRLDGEELAEASDIALCTRTAGAGFYFYWAYPHSTAEDRTEGGLIDKWFASRKKYFSELRGKLLGGEANLDSPKLCEDAAKRAWMTPRYDGPLPVWPSQHWPEWAAIRDKVKPDPRAKWIDDYLARDAAKWALENRGIVWCSSPVFGERVAKLAGLPWHGGGANAEANIMAEDGSRSIIASIKSHGEGRDGLQHKFHVQLVPDPMPSADRWQQLFGRLAREGQTAETVETLVPLHVSENRDALRKAMMYAEFLQATTVDTQLILSADRDFEL